MQSCCEHVVQIRGRAGPLRASKRFLMVSSSVATSGSLGDAASVLPPFLVDLVLVELTLPGVGTALAPETA